VDYDSNHHHADAHWYICNLGIAASDHFNRHLLDFISEATGPERLRSHRNADDTTVNMLRVATRPRMHQMTRRSDQEHSLQRAQIGEFAYALTMLMRIATVR